MFDDGRLIAIGSLFMILGAKVASGSLSRRPWITREGKLGGPGYSDRPDAERHGILSACVHDYGYRSCLSSLLVLLKPRDGVSSRVRKILEKDVAWLKRHREDLEAGLVTDAMLEVV